MRGINIIFPAAHKLAEIQVHKRTGRFGRQSNRNGDGRLISVPHAPMEFLPAAAEPCNQGFDGLPRGSACSSEP